MSVRSVMDGWCESQAIAKPIAAIWKAGTGKFKLSIGQHWLGGDNTLFSTGVELTSNGWRYFGDEDNGECTGSEGVHHQGSAAEVVASVAMRVMNRTHRLAPDGHHWIWLQWIEIDGCRWVRNDPQKADTQEEKKFTSWEDLDAVEEAKPIQSERDLLLTVGDACRHGQEALRFRQYEAVRNQDDYTQKRHQETEKSFKNLMIQLKAKKIAIVLRDNILVTNPLRTGPRLRCFTALETRGPPSPKPYPRRLISAGAS